MIAEAPRHGYDLIKAIEARSGGVYAPSPGMVYPTLTLIADEGLVDEVADGSRKRFTVTDAGRAVIDAEAAVIADAMARLEALAKLRAPTDAAPIRRAMRNLHSAVHGRLSADGVDREIQLQVAAILDEAAGRIERL
ncbi:PadR family transcriptional regulator [Polymorphobacter fuscus]|nr:PadR family transcriptional regulator [Polymorphobacter fuscus]NJC09813.1 DNA-binding PadR family transcriptional regulator [Polymorphobacter fuscus]